MPKLFTYTVVQHDTPVLALRELIQTVMPHLSLTHVTEDLVEIRFRGYLILELNNKSKNLTLYADDHYQVINNILEHLKAKATIDKYGDWRQKC